VSQRGRNGRTSRRQFLRTAAGVTAGLAFPAPALRLAPGSPNEKLNLGVVGVGNRGADNLAAVETENIVALCDVDERYLARAAEKFPKADRYHDFRKMLDRKDLDAVVVSTADHTHAIITAWALRSGRHVYCEKPLTHTVYEARRVTEIATEEKRVTQLGTQIHAGSNYRRVVELIQSKAIGPVQEVHVWVGKSWGVVERPTGQHPVPAYLHWDLWLGPAPERPYHPLYHPAQWRRFWDFGGGTLADMGCHYLDLVHWALGLYHPIKIRAEGPAPDPDMAPPWLIVTYEYPARNDQPPVTVTWYDGGKRPAFFQEHPEVQWGDGVLFVGTEGMLLASYTDHRLLPEEKYKDVKRPEPFLPESPGHHREWLEACKGRGRPLCEFSYSGPVTEAVLLGTVAYRSGEEIVWDSSSLRVTNCPAAQEFLHRPYRKGWVLDPRQPA
jgi:predicted dehydrogenase